MYFRSYFGRRRFVALGEEGKENDDVDVLPRRRCRLWSSSCVDVNDELFAPCRGKSIRRRGARLIESLVDDDRCRFIRRNEAITGATVWHTHRESGWPKERYERERCKGRCLDYFVRDANQNDDDSDDSKGKREEREKNNSFLLTPITSVVPLFPPSSCIDTTHTHTVLF